MPDGSVNTMLRDSMIDRAINLQHYSNAEAQKMIALLNRVDADLSAKLLKSIQGLDVAGTAAHMERILESVREINRDVYASLERELRADLKELSGRELGFQEMAVTRALPSGVLVNVQLSKVSPRQVWSAAMSRPFQGRLLKEWIKGLEATRAARVRDAVRKGIVEGQTTDEIVRTIVGRKSAKYLDGIINTDRKSVVSVVRTAIAHVSGNARQAFFEENDDLIKAVVWTSTLDTGTTAICMRRDGLKYTIDGKPIGHNTSYLAGPGRSHWSCRSVGVPITKSWRELGFDIDEVDEGTRSSMDGYVPAKTTYKDWFAKQSAARQDEVLGPTRGKLYRSGDFTLNQFHNNQGRMIRLDKL